VDFGGLDPQVAQFFNQVIQMPEGFDFLLRIHQEKTPAGIFFEKHYPFAGFGWIGYHMSVKGYAFGMLVFHVITVHLVHQARGRTGRCLFIVLLSASSLTSAGFVPEAMQQLTKDFFIITV
jgi:hypothetical protein